MNTPEPMQETLPESEPFSPRAYLGSAIEARLKPMLAYLERARRGTETEAIHQMRVWSRRSRAALDIAHPVFPGKEYAALEREVKAITRALGGARDLDVMIGALAEREETLPPDQRAGLESFIETLRKQRAEQQKVVVKAARRLERQALLDRFQTLLDAPARETRRSKHRSRFPALPDTSAGLRALAAQAIQNRLDALLDYEFCLTAPEQVYELHQMRIAAKRLRYTLEMFQELAKASLPHPPLPYAEALKEIRGLQERLGEIHDADVLVPLLTAHLARLLRDGYGANKRGEPVVGVHQVDYAACQGLLTLCVETADRRDAQFQQLLCDWRRLREEMFFERLHDLARALAVEETDHAREAGTGASA